ncbi:MAG: UPF0149 family protein, partial [Candidatus Sulfotelmatobacter sp.]
MAFSIWHRVGWISVAIGPIQQNAIVNRREDSALRPFIKPEPLTEAELDRLGDFLDCCEGGKAMNVEELDGFFAALIAGPDVVMPSEYNREVFGGDNACEFA